jgi:hypothetical protein
VLTDGGSTNPKATVLGNGTFTIHTELQQIVFSITFRSDLFFVQTVGIYYGEPKRPGPMLFALAGAATNSPIDGAVYASNLIAHPEIGINTYQDAVNAMKSNKTFVKMDTPFFPNYPNGVSGRIGK